MTDFAYIGWVWLGTVGITFLAWLIIHFNGKVICALVDLVCSISYINNRANFNRPSWLTIATEIEIILLGIMPLAIASLVSTARGNCYSSINSFLFVEAIMLGLFLVIPRRYKQGQNFWGEKHYRSHWAIFAIAAIWCLVFAIWAESAIDPQDYLGAERLLVNKNGDMWYYVRRYAAFTLNNVSFGDRSACYYLQYSPKKLSSFVGSIIAYFTPETALGITLFQGLLGCTLFLSLFGNWYGYSYRNKQLSSWGTLAAIVWAIFSPAIFWLLISAYLSNTLFITIFVLGITIARRISFNERQYPSYAKYLILFAFILNIFSFYLVILPIALLFYLVTVAVYNFANYLRFKDAVANLSKIFLAAGLSILLCSILFNHQIGLEEVSNNLNALKEHGKNFVPLNPWSLVQEKPNPMPNIKDFGVWFNVVVGIIFAGYLLRLIYKYFKTEDRVKNQSLYYRDLIAVVLSISVYIFYLLAYIPLEYTYRLGKLAISVIYPLAILGILPAIIWFRDRYYRHQPLAVKVICLMLAVLHIVLHIDKTMSPKALPLGKYMISVSETAAIDEVIIVGCKNTSTSQKYERLVGLDIAKKYPKLKINVVSRSEFSSQSRSLKSIGMGIDINRQDENLCLFEIKL